MRHPIYARCVAHADFRGGRIPDAQIGLPDGASGSCDCAGTLGRNVDAPVVVTERWQFFDFFHSADLRSDHAGSPRTVSIANDSTSSGTQGAVRKR